MIEYQTFLRGCIQDSPTERAQLDKFSKDFQEIQKWLENLIKGLEKLIQGHQSKRQAIVDLSILILAPNDNMLIDPKVILPITDMITSLKDLNEHFHSQMQSSIIQICANFIKNECSNIRKSKFQYEKMREKFDTLLIRHQAASKTKDSLAFQEDAHNIYQVKISYVKEALTFALAWKSFQYDFDAFFSQIIQAFLNLQCNFYKENQDKLNGLVPSVNAWSCTMKQSQLSFKENLVKLEKFKLSLEQVLFISN